MAVIVCISGVILVKKKMIFKTKFKTIATTLFNHPGLIKSMGSVMACRTL